MSESSVDSGIVLSVLPRLRVRSFYFCSILRCVRRDVTRFVRQTRITAIGVGKSVRFSYSAQTLFGGRAWRAPKINEPPPSARCRGNPSVSVHSDPSPVRVPIFDVSLAIISILENDRPVPKGSENPLQTHLRHVCMATMIALHRARWSAETI